jgi:hypothetical protein
MKYPVRTSILLALFTVIPSAMQAAQSSYKQDQMSEMHGADANRDAKQPLDLAYLNYDTFLYHYYGFYEKDERRVEKIARAYYKNEFARKNEFEQHRVLQKLEPLILKRIAKAKSHDFVTIAYTTDLYRYDFKQKAFRYPVPIKASFERDLFNKSTGRYVVEYAHHKGNNWLYMEENRAEAFIKKNGKSITLLLTVKIKPEAKLRFSGSIQNYQVVTSSGELLDSVSQFN